MEFEPKSEREIRESKILPAGEYDFEVTKAEETTSKKHNPMLVLDLKCFSAEGEPRFIRDYLVSSMELKLNRFCHATGLQDVYNSGALTAFACEGAAGKVKLAVEQSTEYGDKNVVKDYVVAKAAPTEAPAPKAAPKTAAKAAAPMEAELAATGDEIPF